MRGSGNRDRERKREREREIMNETLCKRNWGRKGEGGRGRGVHKAEGVAVVMLVRSSLSQVGRLPGDAAHTTDLSLPLLWVPAKPNTADAGIWLVKRRREVGKKGRGVFLLFSHPPLHYAMLTGLLPRPLS